MKKPIKAIPGLYALFFEYLKLIAKDYGYNLVLHGSMSRDLDLIAIPWVDNPRPELKMIQEFDKYLRGRFFLSKEGYEFSILPGNRHNYVIQLNRGDRKGEWMRFEDQEYYLDISITQINK